jgi:DNA-binding HxlR family transcriptional regulator
VLGERWTFLILREALMGTTRFGAFREALGVAPDVLAARLATLVEYGIMTREPYRDEGSRPRDAYLLTPAGRELQVVLGSLQQWGDSHLPWPDGPTVERRTRAPAVRSTWGSSTTAVGRSVSTTSRWCGPPRTRPRSLMPLAPRPAERR